MDNKYITVVGAGLAGSEAAWRIANSGIKVRLIEMKPVKFSPAHSMNGFAELVCSNSLKAERTDSAAGLLKAEMQKLGSICVESAYECRVPAGGALAVDRDEFSAIITKKLKNHPNIEIVNEECSDIPEGVCVIAAGPLASEEILSAISRLIPDDYLSFYDAAAPIVSFDSIDMDSAFYQSRYDRGEVDDYINCPMNKEQYESFHAELVSAQRAVLHNIDKVYEGCMPVEVLAKRGADTLRFGPLKPVGLRDPKTGHRPWAVVQLRRENSAGTLYNLVGFQTNLKFGEQKRVFSMIPALKNAEFMRYGVMHRNTFLNSPKVLTDGQALKKDNNIFFAGQITGVEGYMESAASGIIAGINAVRRLKGEENFILSNDTMIGALMSYILEQNSNFQPMGANFGILPKLDIHIKDKRERYSALAKRALERYDTVEI